MAEDSTKINSHNCSETPFTLSDSVVQNVTDPTDPSQYTPDNESQRIIHESHENSWQTALLYISIILSVYLITIMFIGVRYALNRYYDKTFDLCCPLQCSQCCQYCSLTQITCECFTSTKRRRNDYFTSSSPSSSRLPTSQLRNLNSAVYSSPDDFNTIEVTQTDEGLLETDL